MPVSKHRKKGQKKAVKRPGAARALKVPVWQLQQDAVLERALAMIDFSSFEEDESEMVEMLLELVLEETMAIGVGGESFSPRIGSRAAVIELFIEEMGQIGDELDAEELEPFEVGDEPEADEGELFRRVAARALDMFAAREIVRFEEDQLILALPIPQFTAKGGQ